MHWCSSASCRWVKSLKFGLSFWLSTQKHPSELPSDVASAGIDRPDLIPGVEPKDVTKGVSRGCGNIKAGTPVGTADLWFDPCAFTIPQLGTLGNAPRNGFRLPGYSRVDLSFMKMIPFGGSAHTELRIDVFNVFNRVNLGIPDRIVYGALANVESPLVTAGTITSADAARQAQLSVRVSF